MATAIQQYDNCDCTAQIAQEYDEHPEITAARMQ